METSHVVFIIVSFIIALCVHLVLKILKPKEEVDTKAFDNILDDQGWAEEEEEEKKAEIKPKVSIPTTPTATPSANQAPSASQKIPEHLSKAAGLDPTTFKKRTDDGPYEIGDRVILKGLVSAKELNGRHGMIADVWNKKTERYPIALDLIDPTKKNAVSVKVCNIEKEPEIPKEMEEKRASAAGGVLDEIHGRVFSFIFSSLRGSVSNALKGEKNPQKLAAFGWALWKQPEGKGIYPSLKEFLNKGIMEQNKMEELEKQLNPTNPEGSYEKVKEAMESPLAVASWNVRVQGEFWVVAVGPDGTLVVPVSHPKQVYCVLGLKAPLGAQVMGKMPRPPKFNLTLVPWYGRLVHDPFLSTTTGSNQVEVASPQLTKELVENTKLAQLEGRVVTRLAQLEVPGGSREGLEYKSPLLAGPPKPDFSKMEPATEEERCLVENMSDFEVFPPGPDGKPSPMAAWNFIRQGVTEEENPKHAAVVLASNGSKLSQFTTKDLDPSPVEIMKGLLSVASKLKKRPFLIGVDDQKCCVRLQFLLQGLKNVRVVLLNVTRKKGPPPGQSPEKKAE